MIKGSLKKIWQNRNKILEGIKNSIFIDDAIEVIANERHNICKSCPSRKYDVIGTDCFIKGTQPCCADCGCSMSLKTRSLSSGCDLGHWEPVLTQEEEDDHNSLNIKDHD